MKKSDDLNFALLQHKKKGGKASRRRQVMRIEQFLKFFAGRGIRAPEQTGRRHVFEWYEEGNLSEATLRDRYYAVKLLWELLGRGDPPKPKSLVINNAEAPAATSAQ